MCSYLVMMYVRGTGFAQQHNSNALGMEARMNVGSHILLMSCTSTVFNNLTYALIIDQHVSQLSTYREESLTNIRERTARNRWLTDGIQKRMDPSSQGPNRLKSRAWNSCNMADPNLAESHAHPASKWTDPRQLRVCSWMRDSCVRDDCWQLQLAGLLC